MEQLHRGAFKTRTGSETQKGSQSQVGVGGKWRRMGLNLPACSCSGEVLVKLRERGVSASCSPRRGERSKGKSIFLSLKTNGVIQAIFVCSSISYPDLEAMGFKEPINSHMGKKWPQFSSSSFFQIHLYHIPSL